MCPVGRTLLAFVLLRFALQGQTCLLLQVSLDFLLLYSSPPRNPQLQLAAEQPSTGECWIPPKKDTPRPRAKVNLQQDGRRGKIAFRIKPHARQRPLEGSNKPCVHQDTEAPQRLTRPAFKCLSVSCKGMGQKWPATEAGALGAADPGMA